jgi:hypothetical protein
MKVWRRKLHAWDPADMQQVYFEKQKQKPVDPLADLPQDEALTMEQVELHLQKLSSQGSIFNPEAEEFTPSPTFPIGSHAGLRVSGMVGALLDE